MRTSLREIKSSERWSYWGRGCVQRTKPEWCTVDTGGVKKCYFAVCLKKSSVFFAEGVEADLHQWEQTEWRTPA